MISRTFLFYLPGKMGSFSFGEVNTVYAGCTAGKQVQVVRVQCFNGFCTCFSWNSDSVDSFCSVGPCECIAVHRLCEGIGNP